MVPFATRLRELRTDRGLSQEALAAAAGVSKATVQNWEANRRSPSLQDAWKAADALGVTLDDLAGRDAAVATSPGEAAERRAGHTELLEELKSLTDRVLPPRGDEAPAPRTRQRRRA